MRRIGLRIRESVSGVYLFNIGAMNAGEMSMRIIWNRIATPAPHTCQVRESRRTIPNSAITARPPNAMFSPSPLHAVDEPGGERSIRRLVSTRILCYLVAVQLSSARQDRSVYFVTYL